MAGKKRYSWEMEDQSQGGPYLWERPELPDLNEDDSDEEEGPVDEEHAKAPGAELRDYLLQQHTAGFLTAKQTCVISYFASKAGVGEVSNMALPPWTVGTGDFKRLLDKQLKTEGPEPYVLNVPSYSRAVGDKAWWGLHVLMPHEVMKFSMVGKDYNELFKKWQRPPNFDSHPVVRKAASQGKSVLPLSIFIDGVAYAKRDSMLIVNVQNLLTGERFVCCCLRKRKMCRCSCKGWETLHTVLQWLRWSLDILAQGRCPAQAFDGNAWPDEDSRASTAGSDLGFLGAVLQLRADWAEIAHTLQVPQWSSGNNPCFLCQAVRENVYARLGACKYKEMAWEPKTPEHWELACTQCEHLIEPLTAQTCMHLRTVLEHDMRKDGAKGLALKENVPALGLKKGDRVEPTLQRLDASDFLNGEPPSSVLFWRRSEETLALRRNPLLSEELGTELSRVAALDVMHTWCLGVFQHWLVHCLWSLADKLPVPGMGGSPANRQHARMVALNKSFRGWLNIHGQEPP